MHKGVEALEESLFCRYCPCAGWCDGNQDSNKVVTGYEFIPDLDHCKRMFEQEPEITYNTFLKAIFELHGSTVNKDWQRFLEREEDDHGNKLDTTDC
jgi:hypothetical protein